VRRSEVEASQGALLGIEEGVFRLSHCPLLAAQSGNEAGPEVISVQLSSATCWSARACARPRGDRSRAGSQGCIGLDFDPFNDFTDHMLVSALRDVELYEPLVTMGQQQRSKREKEAEAAAYAAGGRGPVHFHRCRRDVARC